MKSLRNRLQPPKLPPKSPVPKLNQETLIKNSDFVAFRRDFLFHLTTGSLDPVTWYLLHKKIVAWYKPKNLNDDAIFKKNISTPTKLQKYLQRLNKTDKEKFIQDFLADTLMEYMRRGPVLGGKTVPIYQMMANALSIKCHQVHKNLQVTEYKPECIMQLSKLTLGIQQFIKQQTKMFIIGSDQNSVAINPETTISDFKVHLAVLLKLKNGETCNAQEKELIKMWNLPDKTDKDLIDFIISQIYFIESYHHSRFMLGNYPKHIHDAIVLLDKQNEGESINDYQNMQRDLALLSNRQLHECLSKLLDQTLIILCNECILERNGKLFTEAQTLLNNLKKLTDSLLKAPPKLDEVHQLMDNIHSSVSSIERSYGGVQGKWRALRATFHIDRRALTQSSENLASIVQNQERVEDQQYYQLIKAKIHQDEKRAFPAARIRSRHSTVAQGTELFNKILYTAPKESGAKPGGIMDMLGSDGHERRFMVKQGGTLGETLAELLAYLDIKQMMMGSDDPHKHAAATHLLIKLRHKHVKYADLDDFCNNVFVASQYADTAYALEAFKVAGFDHRPKAAGSFHSGLFEELVRLNAECGLDLEYALHDAIATCDYDFHSGNVMLNFDIKNIEDPTVKAYVVSLINDFKKFIQEHKNHIKLFSSTPEQYHPELVQRINAIKVAGAHVYFQKIDHGYAYYKYNSRECRLDTSNIFLSAPPITTKGTQATNHIAEWTEGDHGPKILLSEGFCRIIRNNSADHQQRYITNALNQFFECLHTAATNYQFAQKAELTLLQAFYKHLTHEDYHIIYSDLDQDIKNIQKQIKDCLVQNKERLAQLHDQYYLKLVSDVSESSPAQRMLQQALMKRCLPAHSTHQEPKYSP